MMLSVCKTFTFDAAHYLPNYEGKCKNLHGHTWELRVKVRGKVNKHTGMVIDFHELKTIIGEFIQLLDHTLLNDTIQNPTAENICLWFWPQIEGRLSNYDARLKLEGIVLYETPGSFAELKSEGDR